MVNRQIPKAGFALYDLLRPAFWHIFFLFYELIFLAYDSPYLIAILPDNIIEVRTIQPSQMVQKIQLDGASSLCAGQTYEVGSWLDKNIVSHFSGCVYVGGDHSSWLLNSKPLLRANVKFLMEMKQFELAIQLAVCDLFQQGLNK